MVGLIISIITFNLIAFITNKRLTKNQIVHIWTFTMAFQVLFDLYIDHKYHAYWYFTKDVEWEALLPLTVLLPPVNMIFLNWYPFDDSMLKRFFYITVWVVFMLVYEVFTLLPEPWGYFNYGWWSLWHSAIADPILLLVLLNYYKWIRKIEKGASTEEIS